jgi:Xaa-Pro aminopeptidase
VAADFTPINWPEVQLSAWLKQHLSDGGRVGFDPWLHAAGQIARLERDLAGTGIAMVRRDTLIDRIWTGQPPPPLNPAVAHPLDLAGESSGSKRSRLAKGLREAGRRAAAITLPDAIMWLLNIRGSDVPRNPVAHGFAILHDDGRVDLFMAAEKLTRLGDHLGPEVSRVDPGDFLTRLSKLQGPVQVDPDSVPQAVMDALGEKADPAGDPCALPKARKTKAEIAGSAAAHLRDGAAMVELLSWLDAQPPGSTRETTVVARLEAARRRDSALRDISFDTIAGSGPNGAVIHYRVTEDSDRVLADGDLLVLDSGGQYLDGTTDITRTIAIGRTGDAERAAFTRVLQGMIAISRLRWPVGLAGRDIDAVARVALWAAGQDYNHGTGHGVGAYLSVHEGPQRLSRLGEVPLEPGMILSNEPGYYREGAFGIRIENLMVVEPAPALPGGDADRAFLCWRTLSFVPIDRRLIDLGRLTATERDWLNAYHAQVAEHIAPRVSETALAWLTAATAPVGSDAEEGTAQ